MSIFKVKIEPSFLVKGLATKPTPPFCWGFHIFVRFLQTEQVSVRFHMKTDDRDFLQPFIHMHSSVNTYLMPVNISLFMQWTRPRHLRSENVIKQCQLLQNKIVPCMSCV